MGRAADTIRLRKSDVRLSQEQRGDADETIRPGDNGYAGDHAAGDLPGVAPPEFPFGKPKLASELQLADPNRRWLWHGYLAPGDVTLLAALWKVGKTTLLAHLLRATANGGDFCGHEVRAGKVFYVAEESEARWAKRRDELGIGDNCTFLSRPFKTRPDSQTWFKFLEWLAARQKQQPADLIVFDTIAALWPVRDENDAARVQEAVQPLHDLTENAAVLLVHHLRKGDGQEATAARGSGALLGFVDTILELRRFDAGNRTDRRRVLTGYSRDDATPGELVVELGEHGYTAQGDKAAVQDRSLRATIAETLPNKSPGWTWNELQESWPEDTKPRTKRLLEALTAGVDANAWHRDGNGRRGSPYRYWVPSE